MESIVMTKGCESLERADLDCEPRILPVFTLHSKPEDTLDKLPHDAAAATARLAGAP